MQTKVEGHLGDSPEGGHLGHPRVSKTRRGAAKQQLVGNRGDAETNDWSPVEVRAHVANRGYRKTIKRKPVNDNENKQLTGRHAMNRSPFTDGPYFEQTVDWSAANHVQTRKSSDTFGQDGALSLSVEADRRTPQTGSRKAEKREAGALAAKRSAKARNKMEAVKTRGTLLRIQTATSRRVRKRGSTVERASGQSAS